MLLATLLVLLIASAFFSIAETSMMALNRYRLKHLVQRGHKGAKRTALLLAKTDKLLGVILLGSNLVNAASATLVAVLAVRFLGSNEIALTIGTLSVTFIILVFSEITPKIVGATYPERIAFPSSYILGPMLKLAYPLIWFVNLFVHFLLWLMRLHRATGAQTTTLSMEELRTLVLEAGKYIPPKHQSILVNLFELENTTVDDIMTPRNQIETIDLDAPLDVIRNQLATSHHTRLPVCQTQPDNIIGIVHVRKVVHQMQTGEMTIETLREVLREPYFIPAGTSLFAQLQHFQENHRRIGLVVDEYGELQGLVSIEDILEEIVGEFTTHAPAQAAIFRRQDDGTWLVDGSSSLRDLNRKLGLSLPLDGPKTLNGLILEHFEDIPEAGTSFKIAGLTMEIVHTHDRVVRVVRIFPGPAVQQ